MLYLKAPAKGIDIPLQRLQEELHEYILESWSNEATGITEDDIVCYGRAYRMATVQGYRPEVYMNDGGYREVLPDTNWAVQTFFGLNDVDTANNRDLQTPIHLIAMVNLGRVFKGAYPDDPAQESRADAEARAVIERFFNQNIHGFTYTNTTRGINNIFAEYTAVKQTQNSRTDSASQSLLKADMQPFHCFRINGTLRYEKPTFYNN